MPISTALPPPSVDILDSWYYPCRQIGQGVNAAMDYAGNARMRGQVNSPQNTNQLGNYGASGGSGSTTQLQRGPAGQECVRVVTTVTSTGGGFKPPLIHASYGPAADWNAGAHQQPSSVVQVYGVTWALSDEVDNWPDDTTGFMFAPNTGVMTDVTRVGSAPQSGFGIFFNTDGAGGVQLDYLSWDGAAVVERVTLPAGIVTDFTVWNSVRFVIVSAAEGREADLTVEINSTPFVTGREFGTAPPQIPFPSAQSAPALHYVFANVASLGGGASYDFIVYGYNGRFNPAGQELQPFG